MTRRCSLLLKTLLLLVFVVANAFAQGTQGSISGTVFDATGGVLPGATVRLLNEGTGQRWNATTSAAGNYRFPALLPGTYTAEAESPGFKAFRNSGVTLQVAQNATLDLRLEVGAVTESVEVKSSSPILNRETAAVGQVIENKQIVDMPLNGRNFLQLGLLVPGASENPGAQSQFSINGMRGNMTSMLFDG